MKMGNEMVHMTVYRHEGGKTPQEWEFWGNVCCCNSYAPGVVGIAHRREKMADGSSCLQAD